MPNFKICVAFLVLFCASGATCLPKRSLNEFKPVQLFQQPPTLEQLAEVLNRTQAVQSLQSNSVSVKVNDELTLRADLTWLRPKNFRMTGTIAGFKGFDLGSNDELFWMSVRTGLTPELFFARHDQFDGQVNRRIIPVSPVWLIEALGINSFDPDKLLMNPVIRADGQWELTSTVPTPSGNYSRTLIVEPLYGLTTQVYLKDQTGRLVANAFQSEHEYYSAVQASLPHKVTIQLSPGFNDPPIKLDLAIGSYVVNGLTAPIGSQFAFPNANGMQAVNLVELSNGISQATLPQQVTAPAYPNQVNYRGVPWDGLEAR